MKFMIVLVILISAGAGAVQGQNPLGPGPHPPHVSYIVAFPPPDGGGTVAATDGAKPTARVVSLQRSGSSFALLVTASESAWVSCALSADGKEFATGDSWIPGGQQVSIGLVAPEFGIVGSPKKYTASCTPQFLSPQSAPQAREFDPAELQSSYGYSLLHEPKAVTELPVNQNWQPTFNVTPRGNLSFVFDDVPPSLNPIIETVPDSDPTARKLKDPIPTSLLEEGKYYRYHFVGTSEIGSVVLAQQNKTYLLYKNTLPQLATAIQLTSQQSGIEIKFGLTRKVDQLEMQFPSGVSLKPSAKPSDAAASFTYDFVIPTDLQTAAASIGADAAQGITKSLSDATTDKGTGTLKLSIIDHDLPAAPTVAEFTLSVVRVSALPLISALKAQNVKLGLDQQTAQTVANQALAINSASSQQDVQAASALATLLQQKGNSKNLKDSILTFLIAVGGTVARAYGIPVPTPSAPPASPSKPTATATAPGFLPVELP